MGVSDDRSRRRIVGIEMPIDLREPNPVSATHFPCHRRLVEPQYHEDEADQNRHASRPPIPSEFA